MSHFNEVANEWDSPQKTTMMQKLANAVISNIDTSKKYRIMDFGTGTGLFGLELVDYAEELVGIDTSSGMLEVFDKKTADYDYVKSHNQNLEESDYTDGKFDLIISSMAFHHLKNPEKMIHKFTHLLNEGGKVIVVDLDKEDGTFHPDNEGMGVKHFGFAKDELENWARTAELKLTGHKMIHAIDKNDRSYEIFMAEFSR